MEVTDGSVHVRWEHIQTIPSQLVQYYGYYVHIETHDSGVSNKVTHNVTFTGAKGSAEITKLMYNTNYTVVIEPFRRQDGNIDRGTAYPSQSFKTDFSSK